MSKQQHTPAPWTPPRVYKSSKGHVAAIAVYGDGGRTTVHFYNPAADDVDDGEHLANAHLIGAAPELLAAAKWVTANLDATDKGEIVLDPDWDAAANALRAAIAKAAGTVRQP